MGFDTDNNNNNNNANANNTEEQISLKISFGNEMRRMTTPAGASYASLCEKTATLFGVDPSGLVLKYQDDDGDKISMSSDIELQEAIRVAKAMKTVLRLTVEVKATREVKEEPKPEPKPEPVKEDVYLGPQGGRFGSSRAPPAPHHPPGFPPFAVPHPHPHPHPHPAEFFHPHHLPAPHFHPFAVHGPELYRHPHRRGPPQTGSFNHFSAPRDTTGTFSPAGMDVDWKKDDKNTYKDNKRAMKEAWKEMRREALTSEDKQKLKELKHKVKAEMRQARAEFRADAKFEKEVGRANKKPRLVARHVEDVTIPDGTELPPNTPFIKTWKIRNEGPTWPSESQLLFISHKGDNLNGPERVVIKGEVLPGQEVEVSVPLITPNEPGRYVGYYRMVTPDGIKFGQRVWVSFIVKGGLGASGVTTSTSSLSSPPPAPPSFSSLSSSSLSSSTLSSTLSSPSFSSPSFSSPFPALQEVSRVCDEVDK